MPPRAPPCSSARGPPRLTDSGCSASTAAVGRGVAASRGWSMGAPAQTSTSEACCTAPGSNSGGAPAAAPSPEGTVPGWAAGDASGRRSARGVCVRIRAVGVRGRRGGRSGGAPGAGWRADSRGVTCRGLGDAAAAAGRDCWAGGASLPPTSTRSCCSAAAPTAGRRSGRREELRGPASSSSPLGVAQRWLPLLPAA